MLEEISTKVDSFYIKPPEKVDISSILISLIYERKYVYELPLKDVSSYRSKMIHLIGVRCIIFQRTFVQRILKTKKGVSRNEKHLFIYLGQTDYIKNPSKIPAATAEPITPATFGPIACINK